MEWQLLKYRLRFPYSRKQKAAMAGRIPMTKELFWSCLETAYCRMDTLTIRMLMHTFHHYIQEYSNEYAKKMSDPNSSARKKADAHWAQLRQKLVETQGEEWVRENCID